MFCIIVNRTHKNLTESVQTIHESVSDISNRIFQVKVSHQYYHM